MRTTEAGNTFLGILLGIIIALSIAIGAALKWGSLPVAQLLGMKSSSAAVQNIPKITLVVPTLPAVDANAASAIDVLPDAPPALDVVDSPPDSSTAQQEALEEPAPQSISSPVAETEGEIETEIIGPPIYEYQIQVGSFNDSLLAEAAKARIAMMGATSRIQDRSSNSGPAFRVVLGPFTDRSEVQSILQKLSENELDGTVVRSIKLISKPRTETQR